MLRRFLIVSLCLIASVRSSQAVTNGSGIAATDGAISTDSNTSGFLANSSSVSCSGSPTGKLIVDTTAGTLAWCNGSTVKQSAAGDDDGDALSLDTGAGTDGSRGIIFNDNTTSPASLSANTTMLHTIGGNLFVYGQAGLATTSPGIPVLPQVKVVTADVTPITTVQDITGLTGYTIKASRKYVIEGSMTIVASAGTADPSVVLTFTGTTTNSVLSVLVSCVLQTNAATSGYRITSSGSAGNCIIGAAQTLNVHIFGFIQGASTNDLTLAVRAAAAGAGNLTVEEGALVRISEFQ